MFQVYVMSICVLYAYYVSTFGLIRNVWVFCFHLIAHPMIDSMLETQVALLALFLFRETTPPALQDSEFVALVLPFYIHICTYLLQYIAIFVLDC
jgi:hypothetical protein